MKKIKSVLLCSSFFAISCFGSEVSEEEYLKQQQTAQLYLIHQTEAEKGDKSACYALANYHYLGRQFVEDPEKIKLSYYRSENGKDRIYYKLGKVWVRSEDYEKAFKFYEQAALEEHLPSLWSLGECYELGRGINQDLNKAVGYYLRAAKEGYPPAQRSLGLMYLEGSGGLKSNDSEAVKWLREAANHGLATAQYNLGMMYSTGRGVKRNENQALEWLRKVTFPPIMTPFLS